MIPIEVVPTLLFGKSKSSFLEAIFRLVDVRA